MPGLSVIKGQGLRATRKRAPTPEAAGQRELIGLAGEGDRDAIEQLLREVGPSMLRVVRTILGVRAGEAEDIFQESLLALIGALPSFRSECGLRHFACRIAARTAVRARRRSRSSYERQLAAATQEEPLREPPPSPRSQFDAEQRKKMLRRLLEELPEAQAETLALRVVLGYSLADVAAATGVPVNTVRSRLRLAKESLRRRIEADPEAAELAEVEP